LVTFGGEKIAYLRGQEKFASLCGRIASLRGLVWRKKFAFLLNNIWRGKIAYLRGRVTSLCGRVWWEKFASLRGRVWLLGVNNPSNFIKFLIT
jgi:hypothetical protein